MNCGVSVSSAIWIGWNSRLLGFFCFDWQYFVDVSMDGNAFVFRVKKSVNQNSSRRLDPEVGGRTTVRNVGNYLPIDTA